MRHYRKHRAVPLQPYSISEATLYTQDTTFGFRNPILVISVLLADLEERDSLTCMSTGAAFEWAASGLNVPYVHM